MPEPTNLSKYRKVKRKATARQTTLCKRGFHKWEDEPRKQFDVKAGKLVSEAVCVRCGKRTTRVS